MAVISVDYLRYVDHAVEAELAEKHKSPTKRAIWEKMGDDLEVAGFPKHQIGQIIRKSIDEALYEKTGLPLSVANGWFYDVMSMHDWSDPEQDREPTPGQEQEIVPTGAGRENARLSEVLSHMTVQITEFRRYLAKNKFTSYVDQAIMDDLEIRIEAFAENAADYMSSKRVVPSNALPILFDLFNSANSINNLFDLFFDEIRVPHLKRRAKLKAASNHILTPKMLKKIMSRNMVSVHKHLEFQTRNEARLAGFFGQQCPQCGGFRTRLTDTPGEVTCLRCQGHADWRNFRMQPYVSCPHCQYVLTPGAAGDACPHCGTRLILPMEVRAA